MPQVVIGEVVAGANWPDLAVVGHLAHTAFHGLVDSFTFLYWKAQYLILHVAEWQGYQQAMHQNLSPLAHVGMPWHLLAHLSGYLLVAGMISNHDKVLAHIDRLIKSFGLNRAQLAACLKLDQSYFQKMMTSKRALRLDVIEKVAEYLGLPIWKLFKVEGEAPVAIGYRQVPLVDPPLLLAEQEGRSVDGDSVRAVIQVPELPDTELAKRLAARNNLVAVEMVNSSKATFVVDLEDREPEDNKHFLVHLPQRNAFKIARMRKAGKQWLAALNDELHTDYTIIARGIFRMECL